MSKNLNLNKNPDVLINWFDDFNGENEFAFLSNFFIGDYHLEIDDMLMEAKSTEHLFAAAKTTDLAERIDILGAASPGTAKDIGRRVKLRPDWQGIKVGVMQQCLANKFRKGTLEAEMLLTTGTADLVEGTFWNDRIWGVDLTAPGSPGMNLLGALLIAQRARLR